ncbi:Hsp20/alpha crystallin family protein [Azospirillum sp. CT11-132]|jgi:HSP20 family protein|uniref:Hsp20/alpha crystallin family protein n=1 Tax=unclassified Azospirillum TaxID=2630922 RepID=UPI000D64269B|nr:MULTISPECIES: Hsp20/alpha crystallin family protein [unclassified Azospirillum]QCG95875.1 Hsp20/alpha crystallin family protein [Azospirillum sp. TSA2s]
MSMTETSAGEKPKELKTTGMAAKEVAERNRHPLFALRDEFDRLFDEASSMLRFPWSRRPIFGLEPLLRSDADLEAIVPPAEVDERETEYRVTLEIPGMDEKDAEVSIQDDILTVKAEKKEETEEKDKNRYFSERRYGLCARTFRLPANVKADAITASMKNGVLTIVLPKSEPSKPTRRTIEIAKV